jgi:hypothetical protein
MISADPSRTGAVALDGATATGPVAVFLTTDARPLTVVFEIDGQHASVERTAPYDLEGTTAQRTAQLLAPPESGAVVHSVTAHVYWGDGSAHQVLTGSFTQSPISPVPSSTEPSPDPTSEEIGSATPSPDPTDGASGTPGATSTPGPSGSDSPSPTVPDGGSPATSASPTASPTPTSGQPTSSPPDGNGSDDAMPDASNTGPHGVLTPTGSLTITKPGTYSNLDVHGHIDVLSTGVTLTNLRVDASDAAYAIRNKSDGHLTITDCDLGPTGTPTHQTDAAVVYADYTLLRCNVHGTGDGLKAHGDTVIEDSYIHDMFESGGNHSDGIQISSGSHVLIEHNTIVSAPLDSNGVTQRGTSCIIVKADQGPIDDVQIIANSLSGDPGFLLYDRRSSFFPTPTNVVIAQNVLGPRQSYDGAGDGYIWGVLSSDTPAPTVWGNVSS